MKTAVVLMTFLLASCAGMKKQMMFADVTLRMYPLTEPGTMRLMTARTMDRLGETVTFVRYPLARVREEDRAMEMFELKSQFEKALSFEAERWHADDGLEGFWIVHKKKRGCK